MRLLVLVTARASRRTSTPPVKQHRTPPRPRASGVAQASLHHATPPSSARAHEERRALVSLNSGSCGEQKSQKAGLLLLVHRRAVGTSAKMPALMGEAQLSSVPRRIIDSAEPNATISLLE